MLVGYKKCKLLCYKIILIQFKVIKCKICPINLSASSQTHFSSTTSLNFCTSRSVCCCLRSAKRSDLWCKTISDRSSYRIISISSQANRRSIKCTSILIDVWGFLSIPKKTNTKKKLRWVMVKSKRIKRKRNRLKSSLNHLSMLQDRY